MQPEYLNKESASLAGELGVYADRGDNRRWISWEKFKRLCVGVDRVLNFIFSALIITGGALIVLAVVLQVVLRYIFKAPMFGLEEFSLMIAIWVYFLGAILGTKLDGHVQGDVAERLFTTPGKKAVVKVIAWALCCTTCTLFLYHSASYGHWVYESGERTAGLWWPRITSVGSMFFGAVFMTLYSVVNIIKYCEAAIAASRHN